jgi:hypothetical protein
MESVWFDFGGDIHRHDEETPELMDAFVQGVHMACECLKVDDYRQFDTLAEVQAYLQETT